MIPLPLSFIDQMREMLGDEAPAFFASLEAPAALALRINPARPAAADAAAEFAAEAVPWEPNGRYLRPNARAGASIAHAAGAFYLQEASAMASVSVLRPASGERILDLCAAPGGKSTQIAAALMGEGLLISNEPEPARAKVLAANLERMGVRNAAVVCAYPDALAARWPNMFDAVLCDAPCSGEGMFRRDPNARSQWNPASPAGCARRQIDILDAAARMVRPGGRLVYSTCTFNQEENERGVAAFCARNPDFAPEDFDLPGVGRSEGGMIRLFPHRLRGDGHFCARLRKSGEPTACEAPPSRPSRESIDLSARLEREVGALPEALKANAMRVGDLLIARPPRCPELNGLRVVSSGVQLARIGRSHIEPAHALAMAMDVAAARQTLDLDAEDARRYLSGETLACADALRGWTLICHRALALGWGKASGGQMKNHLPKGLRLHNLI